MTCQLPYHNSKDNLTAFLAELEVISETGNQILDLPKFREVTKQVQDDLLKTYGIKGNPFIEDDLTGSQTYYTDDKVFDQIDQMRKDAGLYEDRIAGFYVKGETNPVNLSLDNLYQYTSEEVEGIVSSEKTIRELSAKISDRIGLPYKIISDRTQKFKGKIENNVSVINLVYATLDTPVHEILGHPIIRAIKNKTIDGNTYKLPEQMSDGSGWAVQVYTQNNFEPEFFKTEKEALDFYNSKQTQLYQNLLKELETGRGKEVLDRIKRDYVNKNQYNKEDFSIQEEEQFDIGEGKRIKRFTILNSKNPYAAQTIFKNREDAQKELEKLSSIQPYTLEEQQEEAIVELMSLMAADKLNKITDKNLISLLKQLLKQINDFIKSLLNTKELNINDIEVDNTKFLIENKLKELIKNGIIKKEC
jgi:hypothetical protein